MEERHEGDRDIEIQERANGLITFGALLLLASLLIVAIIPISLRSGSYFVVKMMAVMLVCAAATIGYGLAARRRLHRAWEEATTKARAAGKS